jgi:hypothetical protein
MSLGTGYIVQDGGLLNITTPKVKPGANIFFNRDGTLTGKAGYTTAQTYGVPAYSIGFPHPNDGSCYLAQYGLTWDAAGFIEMDGDYVGVWSTTNYLVDGIAATQQEPIVTNPVFTTVLGGVPGSPMNNAYFDPTSGEFVCWPANAPNNLGGVQSWLAGGLVLRVTNATLSSSDITDAIELLGTSTDSFTAGIITYSYGYFAFLYTNVTYKEVPIGGSSATFTLTVEVTFTPPNGWNTLIYQTGA